MWDGRSHGAGLALSALLGVLACGAEKEREVLIAEQSLEIQTLKADLALAQHDHEVCEKRVEVLETELAKIGRGDGSRGEKPRPAWMDWSYGFIHEQGRYAVASARTAHAHSVTLESAKARATAELAKLTSQPGELYDHWVDPRDGTVYALVGERRAIPVSGSRSPEEFEATKEGVMACARKLDSHGKGSAATALKVGLGQAGNNAEALARLLRKCQELMREAH